MAFWNKRPTVESLGALTHQADLKSQSQDIKQEARAVAKEATAGDVRVRSTEKYVSLFPKEENIKRDKSFFGRAKEKMMGFFLNREGQKQLRMQEAQGNYRGKNFLAEAPAQQAEAQAEQQIAAIDTKARGAGEANMESAAALAAYIEGLNGALEKAGYKKVSLEPAEKSRGAAA